MHQIGIKAHDSHGVLSLLAIPIVIVGLESSLAVIFRTRARAYCCNHVCKLEIDHYYYLSYVTQVLVNELDSQVEKHLDHTLDGSQTLMVKYHYLFILN